MKHRNKRILGIIFIIVAIPIRLLFPDADFIPYITGGLFGGGFVLLFAEKNERKPEK